MKAYGSQIIAEFIGCQSELLNQRRVLEALLAEGIERFEMQLKSLNSYQFEPIGVTVIAIIGESHVALHTYPEERHLSLDIFTCRPGSANPARLLEFLAERFQPELVRSKELTRGLSLELSKKDYITDFSRGSFDVRYHVQAEILSQRTAFQQLMIIDNRDFGRMLFLDHELQIASADAELYHQALLRPLAGRALDRVAILGGGDGGVLRALLELPVKEAWLVDIDVQVIEASRRHLTAICGQAFEDPRLQLVIAEACEFLAEVGAFDAIICDLTTAPERLAHALKSSYYPRLFGQIQQRLKPAGVLSLQVGSALDTMTLEQARYWLQPLFKQLSFETVFIPSFCEPWVFGWASQVA